MRWGQFSLSGMAHRPWVLTIDISDELLRWLENRVGGVILRLTEGDTFDGILHGSCALVVVDPIAGGWPADGLELTSDGRRRKPPVVYYVDQAAGGRLGKSYAGHFGVGPVLVHPVDREPLARLVASALDQRGPNQREERTMPETDTMELIAELWEQFKGKMFERVAVLVEASGALLDGGLDEELRKKAQWEAHKLAGSVGTFGFAEASRIAAEIENLVQSAAAPGETEGARLSELVHSLRQELAQSPSDPSSRSNTMLELPATA